MDSFFAFPELVPFEVADFAVGRNVVDTDERPPLLIIEVPNIDVFAVPPHDDDSLDEVYEKILLDAQTENVLVTILDVLLNVCLGFQSENVDAIQKGNFDELTTTTVQGAPAA
jgi:hypothetical protein